MARQLHIGFLILCLGLFIVPKQYFLAQNSSDSCCVVSVTKKDHCKAEHKKNSCSKENQHKNHCTGNCNNCDICHFSIAVFQVPMEPKIPEITTDLQIKKEQFTYITPEISSIYSKIWQPPKIG